MPWRSRISGNDATPRPLWQRRRVGSGSIGTAECKVCGDLGGQLLTESGRMPINERYPPLSMLSEFDRYSDPWRPIMSCCPLRSDP
jgi:hypothetical protein